MAQQKGRGDLSNEERIQQIMSELGKVPPQHIEMEEAVLGALLLDSESYFRIGHILKPDMFYKDIHRIIYEAIQSFAGIKCDLYSLVAKLKEQKKLELIGGPYFLTQLTTKVASSAHLENHVSYIEDAWKSRECIRIGSQIQQAAFESSVDDVARMDLELNEVLFGSRKLDIVPLSSYVPKAVDNILSITNGTKTIIGISTGFNVLDRFLYGLQAPDLFVIAGRPSMGKTAFAFNIGEHVAKTLPVLMFSMEMSAEQLVNRDLATESRLDGNRFKIQGGINKDQVQQLINAGERLKESKMLIDDTPAQHITDLKNKARRAHRLYGIRLIIVDYIQLARGTAKNRDQEIGQITQGLKSLAKELDIPVIALSQLNRGVENRTGRRPNLSDLRESGNIESDADVILFVHRPERYKIMEFSDGTSTKGIAEIIIEKNRNGAVGDLVMRFVDNLTLFEDMELDEINSSKKYESRESRLFDAAGDFEESPF